MMNRRTVKHNIDGLAALLLFAVFAVCILMVLLTGTDAYRRLTNRDSAAHAQRTAVQYVAQRVRQADRLDGVELEDFEGVQALVLGAGEEYVTRIYCYDGSLMELYSAPADGLGPADGERIMAAQAMELSAQETNGSETLTVAITQADGQRDELVLSLRSGEGWNTK